MKLSTFNRQVDANREHFIVKRSLFPLKMLLSTGLTQQKCFGKQANEIERNSFIKSEHNTHTVSDKYQTIEHTEYIKIQKSVELGRTVSLATGREGNGWLVTTRWRRAL